jgi:hypothetical protein
MTLASPFSTGGGGESFEKLAGACTLAALLAREEVPGLDLPVTKVRFQQRYAGHLLDDIVIDGASRGVRRTLEIQARHCPRLTASDPKFVELVAVFLRAMRDNRAAMLNDTRRLGLLLELGTPGSKSLHQVARLAWANSDPTAFYQAIAAQGHTSEPVRDRLGQLVKAKAAADQASEIAEDPELWMLLRGLRVLPWSRTSRPARIAPTRSTSSATSSQSTTRPRPPPCSPPSRPGSARNGSTPTRICSPSGRPTR